MANNNDWEGAHAFHSREQGCGEHPVMGTPGGPPDLPRWYRERQFDLFELPAAAPAPKAGSLNGQDQER